MAIKKTVRRLRIHVAAGEANPGSVGKDIGPLGLNLMEFCRQYNAATQHLRGFVVPAELTVYEDRSFDIAVLTPTTSSLLRHAAGIERGSARPQTDKVGVLTRAQLREVARVKLPDLNTSDLDQAERTVAGTARSMGIEVKD